MKIIRIAGQITHALKIMKDMLQNYALMIQKLIHLNTLEEICISVKRFFKDFKSLIHKFANRSFLFDPSTLYKVRFY